MYSCLLLIEIGIIQNMSYFHCSKCQNVEYIFGRDGAVKLAKESNCEVLDDIPLHTQIRESCDDGQPICISHKDHKISLIYKNICERIISYLNI